VTERERETERQRQTETEKERQRERERHTIRVRFSKDVKQLRPIPQKFVKKYFCFIIMKITLPLLYTERGRYREESGERERERQRKT
jgi:hypothetical protein